MFGFLRPPTSLRRPLFPADNGDLWEGPDDLWPGDDVADNQAEPQDNSDHLVQQTVTLIQWGLRLPDRTISWGSWRGIPFDNPLDRIRMIAALQKTASEIGFSENQTSDFLQNYGWATREVVVLTTYSPETCDYVLDDPIVADAHHPSQEEEVRDE